MGKLPTGSGAYSRARPRSPSLAGGPAPLAHRLRLAALDAGGFGAGFGGGEQVGMALPQRRLEPLAGGLKLVDRRLEVFALDFQRGDALAELLQHPGALRDAAVVLVVEVEDL